MAAALPYIRQPQSGIDDYLMVAGDDKVAEGRDTTKARTPPQVAGDVRALAPYSYSYSARMSRAASGALPGPAEIVTRYWPAGLLTILV